MCVSVCVFVFYVVESEGVEVGVLGGSVVHPSLFKRFMFHYNAVINVSFFSTISTILNATMHQYNIIRD